MAKLPTKVLSSAAVLAMLSAPMAPYAVHAATPETAATPTDGFYVANPDGSKLYFTLDELFDNSNAVTAAIDAAGFDNVYFIEDGAVVNLDKMFEGTAAKPYEPGDVPGGEYKKTDGTTTPPVVETPAEENFEVTDIAAINETTVTVKFPSDAGVTAEGLKGKTLTLKAGESTFTATYVVDTFASDAATFELAEGEALVVDTAYAVTSSDLKVTEGTTVKLTAPDTEAPVLAYDGETTLTVANGADFVVPTVTATDNKDEEVAVTTTITNSEDAVLEAIDTTVAGEYTITYTAVDAAGNEATPVVVTVTVEKSAAQVELEKAVAEAEAAIVAIPAELNADNVKNFKTEIEAARTAVDAVTKLDATAVVEGMDKLVAAETLLDSVTAEVANLKTTVKNDTRSVDVSATIKNLEADVITVGLYATDEKGVKTGAALVEETILPTELDENKAFTTSLDLKDETVAKGSYIVEVTAAEGEATSTVAIDFTAADATVKAVNEAASELALEEALAGFTGVESANITKYRAVLGSTTPVNKTISEVQAKIDSVNKDVKESTLVAELQTLAAGPQKALLTKLQEKFENVDAKNIVAYQSYLAGETVTGATKPSDVQKQINVINTEADLTAAKATLTTALEVINVALPKEADVTAAKAALEAVKTADKAEQLTKNPEATYTPIAVIGTSETAITTAEGKIAQAKEDAEALATAVQEAKVAQKNYLLAGGSKTDAVYTNVTEKLEADTQVTDEITSTTGLLNADTQTLKDIKAMIPVAEKSLADYKDAGGDITSLDTDYKKVEGSLAVLKNTAKTTAEKKIELGKLKAAVGDAGSVAKLNAATKALVDASELMATTIAAADKAVADFEAIGGNLQGTKAQAVSTNVAKLKLPNEETSHADALLALNGSDNNGAIKSLNVLTESIKDTRAAATKSLADFVAAGGKEDNIDYTTALAALDVLKANDKSDVEYETAATLLNNTVGTEGSIKKVDSLTKEIKDVKAINAAVTAEDAVALQNIIVNLNVSEFADLSKAQRAEIGKFMIRASKEEGYEAVATTTAFKGSVTSAISDYTGKVDAFNNAANAAAPFDATKKKAVIDAIKAVTDLENLTASEELDLAERIFASKPVNGYAVKTITEIEALVNATPYSVQ